MTDVTLRWNIDSMLEDVIERLCDECPCLDVEEDIHSITCEANQPSDKNCCKHSIYEEIENFFENTVYPFLDERLGK